MTFKQFLEHNPQKIYGSMTSNPNGPSNTVGVHNDGNTKGNTGTFVSTAWSGSESNTEKPFVLPGVDLVKDDSPIKFVNGDVPRPNYPPKNPIEITLKSGRSIFMTWDEFRRGGGSEKIAKNKKVKWTLQPRDNFYQVQKLS